MTRPVNAANAEQREEQLAELGLLMADVMHDVAIPLQTISFNLDYLRSVAKFIDDAEAENAAQAIQTSLAVISEARKLIDATKAIARRTDHLSTLTNPTKLLSEVAGLVRGRVRPVADLHLDIDGLPEFATCSSHLRRVILNLLVNAADAVAERNRIEIRAKGNVTLSAKFEDDELTIQVSDDGIGVTDEARELIFDRFYTTKDHGTGLGLAMVADAMANCLPGIIEVESTLNIGTTFIISLENQTR